MAPSGHTPYNGPMPKFLIERNVAGAGSLSPSQLQAISQESCNVLRSLGPHIQWVHSYVTEDKIYCVYIAPDEASIRRHAELGGFPVDRISVVSSIIDPVTEEQQ